MRIYLDNCCFNRPFDDQDQIRIRLEAEAKLNIQERVQAGTIELAWSYILDYENQFNPFNERREAIGKWRARAAVDIDENVEIVRAAKRLCADGLRPKDALHVACAAALDCEFFVTTDDGILNRLSEYRTMRVVDPTEFVRAVSI